MCRAVGREGGEGSIGSHRGPDRGPERLSGVDLITVMVGKLHCIASIEMAAVQCLSPSTTQSLSTPHRTSHSSPVPGTRFLEQLGSEKKLRRGDKAGTAQKLLLLSRPHRRATQNPPSTTSLSRDSPLLQAVRTKNGVHVRAVRERHPFPRWPEDFRRRHQRPERYVAAVVASLAATPGYSFTYAYKTNCQSSRPKLSQMSSRAHSAPAASTR